MITNNIVEQLFLSTVRIELPNEQSMGTGFFCNAKAKNGEQYHFIVTNKHVISNASDNLRLILNIKDSSGKSVDLGKQWQLNANSIDKESYFDHPNPDIDLICINISNAFNLGVNVAWTSIGLEMIANYQTDGVFAGNDIFFIGYPDDKFDQINNLPILRSGKIGSLPQVDFENEPTILIDAQVFPGSSGSPVFSVCNGSHKLIGVVSRTMLKNHELKISDKINTAEFQEILGIGIVIKSKCVTELLENAITLSNNFI